MTPLRFPLIAGLALLACTGCSQPQPAQKQVPQQNAAAAQKNPGVYASDDQACGARAQSRMGMYDRPDTYPISDQERHDAYLALYSACMRGHDWQIAGPVHAPASDTAQLANLAPAAGGNRPATNTVTAGNSVITTTSGPGGATIITIGSAGSKDAASQLSSLSPSSGGASSPNTTVVLLSQQNQNPAMPKTGLYAPSAPLPVAVPLPPPPVAKAYTPASPLVAPPPPPIPPQQSVQRATPQPSLAGADATATGAAPPPAVEAQNANQQLENVLEK